MRKQRLGQLNHFFVFYHTHIYLDSRLFFKGANALCVYSRITCWWTGQIVYPRSPESRFVEVIYSRSTMIASDNGFDILGGTHSVNQFPEAILKLIPNEKTD